ncbi:MAG: SPOR domain-containing protein [Pseudomonadota bacterium]
MVFGTAHKAGHGGTVASAGNRRSTFKILASVLAVFALAGCGEGTGGFGFLQPNAQSDGDDPASRLTTTKLVERDVEAPDVFQVTESGLWDGRPSLGGVWVAHPDVTEPERVIIRNTANSKFVIGALFKRERENPGPSIQVSSDAADALGMLAGAPSQLNVTALRREEAPVEELTPALTEELAAASVVETQALDPVAGAAAAIEEAEADPQTASTAQTEVAATPVIEPVAGPAQPARVASSLSKPFIQIGIFSVEQNARNTATAMRQNGMVPTVLEQASSGKDFWRVIVGPATSTSERSALLKQVKGMGFEDAYAVTN